MAADVASASQATMKLENTEKRDTLIAVEKKYQKQWSENHIWEANAPSADEDASSIPKFFATMAYPYVNGTPHLGHAFTVSKVDFAARVARHSGRRVLYPQGWHATGMPIKACADKIANEIKMFGKNFEGYREEEQEDEIAAPTEITSKTDITKFSAKKTKALMKSGGKTKYQFLVMLNMGIPKEQIHKFADSQEWLHYLPTAWQEHLQEFGCSIDWYVRNAARRILANGRNGDVLLSRRMRTSIMIHSYSKWQVNRLKEMNKIQYGSRYTVYSPLDQQPCLDHDRSSGEGVLAQEYTAVKCKVMKFSGSFAAVVNGKLPADASVFLVPATLRPETMYGQTNVFVSPKIIYGIFKTPKNEYYLMTERAARNMAYQEIFEWGNVDKVASISGADVIGTLVNAPLSFRKEGVYVVPMDTIKDTKGTGVVTSVPSDSPDDWIMTSDLHNKPEYYKIQPEWVSLDILPIIDTPKGNLIASTLVKEKKIQSPKDAKALTEAKEEAYKVGFYQGKMIYGDYKGVSVQDAKPKVRQDLLNSGEAFPYAEPDGLVISRSGDTCVVAKLAQNFLAYGDGDPAWREAVLEHVKSSNFNAYSRETLHSLEQNLGWLNQWALTRQFGLGTHLPWDKSQLVESLSDSTIYMAYYTVAKFLHKDMFGKTEADAHIQPSQMTEAVWDYVFCRTEAVDSDIPQATLEAMRREFSYWYPLDVRISGKDLLNNHLMFFLYIHQAIWNGLEDGRWLPRGIRSNGHVMLNGEKMSKSTGSFLTLDDAVKKFGADATRIMLADAGDSSLEDANADEAVANTVILKLFELKNWAEDIVGHPRLLRSDESFLAVKESKDIRRTDTILRTEEKSFWDELFENELNTLAQEAIQHYQATSYRLALKASFFDLIQARDNYRVATLAADIGMHQSSVRKYIEFQAILLAPIAPHWADYIWQEVLKNKSTICLEPFPTVAPPKESLTACSNYVRSTTSSLGAAEGHAVKKRAKGKATNFDPKSDKKLTIFVAQSWPAWQDKCVEAVRELFDGVSLDQSVVSKRLAKESVDKKKAMPFVSVLKKRLDAGEKPETVFNRKLLFDEVQVLKELKPGLKSTVAKLTEVVIVVLDADGKTGTTTDGQKLTELAPVAQSAEPGSPAFEFTNV